MDQVCVQGKGNLSQCVKQIKDALHEKQTKFAINKTPFCDVYA